MKFKGKNEHPKKEQKGISGIKAAGKRREKRKQCSIRESKGEKSVKKEKVVRSVK